MRYRSRFASTLVVCARLVLARACSAPLLAILVALGPAGSTPVAAGPIEAIRGKSYPLTSRHGPWMIKVTSLFEEAQHQEQPIANELVYQLRKKGIPAYTHRQTEESEEIESVDRLGRPRHQRLTSQRAMIAVLAGNYEKPEDKTAQQSLKYIKKFKPNVTVEWQGKDVPVPLIINKAFLTKNPLLPPEELAKKNRDPLILKLNSGVDHSLFENKGRYTLIVASFFGQSKVKPSEFREFDKMLDDKSKISLDNAARESWQLMSTMRKYKMDAYVYHDRYKSIVTVGSFKTPNDPEIQQLTEQFRIKEEKDPKTGQVALKPAAIQIPGRRKNDPIIKTWLMDPVPQLMEVPK